VLPGDQLESLAPTGEFAGDELGVLFPKGGFSDPVLTTDDVANTPRFDRVFHFAAARV